MVKVWPAGFPGNAGGLSMYFYSLPDQQELNWDRHKNQVFPDTAGLRFYKVHHPTPPPPFGFLVKNPLFLR